MLRQKREISHSIHISIIRWEELFDIPGTIVFVHKSQELERESMYQGVIRDQERRSQQREQNIREFDETRALHAELVKDQPDVGSKPSSSQQQ
ncbi:hypothetical protein IWW48_003562 [Coemansia sp. RSA 1200]|nr:hypothetical protein IWW48_003562 [Coemansia sp. RSA 1200]